MPAFFAVGTEQAGPALTGWARQEAIPRDSTLIVAARLQNDSSPVSNATVQCRVTAPDSTQTLVALDDDGAFPDSTANDGIYTGAIATTSIAGYYKLHFIAEGIAGTVDFGREASASAAVTASNAVLGSTFTVAKVDSNANGVADLLRVAVSVTTNVAGEFSLAGTLSDSFGNKVSASTIVSLQVGEATINLDFDGRALFANGVDGPYSIGDIALFEHGPLSLRPARTSSMVIATDPYSHFEFEHESPIRLVGPGASEGLFLDVNGFYDALRVRLPVHVDRTATYRWSAALTDSTGVEIATAGAEGSLAAGADTLVLDFSGYDIGTHGVDGKYTVRDLWVGGGGGTLSQALAHTTEYFFSEQFEPGSETTPKVRVLGTFVYNDSLLGANSTVLFPRIVVYDTKDRCAGCDSTALQPVAYGSVNGPGGGFAIGPIPNVDRDDDNGPLDLLVRVYYQREQIGAVGSTARYIVNLADSTGALWHFDAPLQENVTTDELNLGELRPPTPATLQRYIFLTRSVPARDRRTIRRGTGQYGGSGSRAIQFRRSA